MARFPTYERQQGISGGGRMPYMDGNALTGPARALMGLGNAVGDLGDEFAQTVAKSKNDQTNAQLSKDTSQMQIDMSQQDIEAQQSATGRAENFTADADKRFEDYRKKVLANNPDPDYQQRFNAWADDYRAKYITKAATFQAGSAVAQRTSDLATALSNYEQLVYSDPSQYEKVRKESAAALDAAKSWLTPEQETNLRAKHEHDLNLARAKGKADADPAGFLADTGVSRVGSPKSAADVIRRFEGFRETTYWDVNAHRTGYGSDTVTRADGSVVRVQQGMRVSREDAERDLQRRIDTEFVPGIIKDVGKDAWAKMPESAKAALTSVAYNYGSLPNRVAQAVATGNVENVAQAVESLKGHNGGVNSKRRQQEADLVRGKDIGGYTTGPTNIAGRDEYAGLSIDEIRSLTNQAETAHNSAQASAYAGLKDQIELGVATGAVTSEQQIIDSGLNGGDVATLLGKFRTANNDRMAVVDTLAALNGGTYQGDPYDPADRKNIDNAAAAIKQQAPQQYQAATEEIVRQSGIVPKDVVNDIRAGLESRDPSDVSSAAQRAQRLAAINPAALGRRDGGSAVQDAADDFGFYVNTLNLSPEDAAKRLIENRDPEKQRDRKALEPAAKEYRKAVEDTDIGSLFNDSWFASDPALGFNPQQESGIKADFLAIAENEFFRANGDPDLATQRATEQMKRLYGVTELTGRKTLMKHPPERYWPTSKFMTSSGGPFRGADSTLGYAQAQLRADLEAIAPGVDMSSVEFVTTPETDREVKRGELPGYAIMWRDQNGNYQTLTPGRQWKPDVSRALRANEDERAREIEAARQDQAEERQSIEEMRAVPAFGRDPEPLGGQP